jgi:hypothetical protein
MNEPSKTGNASATGGAHLCQHRGELVAHEYCPGTGIRQAEINIGRFENDVYGHQNGSKGADREIGAQIIGTVANKKAIRLRLPRPCRASPSDKRQTRSANWRWENVAPSSDTVAARSG